MRRLSPRNLEYMPASAEAAPDQEIVQQAVAQLAHRACMNTAGGAMLAVLAARYLVE